MRPKVSNKDAKVHGRINESKSVKQGRKDASKESFEGCKNASNPRTQNCVFRRPTGLEPPSYLSTFFAIFGFYYI